MTEPKNERKPVTYRPWTCTRCGDEFQKASWHKGGWCRCCAQEHQRATRYGVTVAELREAIDSNDGTCDICGAEVAHGKQGKGGAYVDHDHGEMRLRGILCHHCNTGLGMFFDDPARLLKAVDYLAGIERA